MSIGFNVLTSGETAGSANAFTTASVTTATNSLVLVVVCCREEFPAVVNSLSVSGLSLTWDRGVEGVLADRAVGCFRAMGTGASGTITVTSSRTAGTGTFGFTYAVIEVTGVVTGTNGLAAVNNANPLAVNAVTLSGPQPSVTIPGTPSAGDITFAFVGTEDAESGLTEEAGWTNLVRIIGVLDTSLDVMYNTSQDQSATWSGCRTDGREAIAVGALLKVAAGGASPFYGSTFENPTRQRRSVDALNWTSNDLTIRLPVAPVAAPFTMTDWPNPRGRAPLNTSFSSNYAIDDSVPFAQLDWPNPVRAKRNTDGLSWQDELNTLLFAAPGVPFRQLEWPNPVRAKRSTDGLSWQDELNTLLFTAPVTLPFRQLSWPNPLGPSFSVSLRGFTQASAFWMLKDTFYGAPGQPPSFAPPINPRGPVFPMSLRGSTQDALTILPTPPVFTFNPAWAQGSNRTVGFGIEPE